jgi:hypothetical protein
MPEVRASIRNGDGYPGGKLKGYPLDQLYREVAFLAYYFHWPYHDVMDMEHRERRQWCEEVSRINRTVNDEARAQVQ